MAELTDERLLALSRMWETGCSGHVATGWVDPGSANEHREKEGRKLNRMLPKVVLNEPMRKRIAKLRKEHKRNAPAIPSAPTSSLKEDAEALLADTADLPSPVEGETSAEYRLRLFEDKRKRLITIQTWGMGTNNASTLVASTEKQLTDVEGTLAELHLEVAAGAKRPPRTPWTELRAIIGSPLDRTLIAAAINYGWDLVRGERIDANARARLAQLFEAPTRTDVQRDVAAQSLRAILRELKPGDNAETTGGP